MQGRELGSAQWSCSKGYDFDELKQHNLIFGYNKNTRGWYGHKLNKHFITIASNRSGKGASQIIPNLCYYQGSVFVIDPKGELAYITAPRRRELGQKTYVLDPWGEVNRRFGSQTGENEEVATFNPLSLLDMESPDFIDDLAYIADSLIINQGKDPFFDDSARELVSGIIAYTLEIMENPSLYDVKTLLSKSIEEVAGMAQHAEDINSNSIAARKLGRFKKANKENTSVLSTAQTQLAILDNPALAKNMVESSFSFEDLTEGKATLYLVLPTDKLQTYGRWLRLMVSLGIRQLSRNTKKLDMPVLFILDEFGTIGKLSAVAQAVGLMAGLQMCVWAFIQDLNQLKRDYPQDWGSFIANAAAITVLDVMDNFTAEYISKLLGNTTVEVLTDLT